MAIHDAITSANVRESLQQMCDYARTKGIQLAFEATLPHPDTAAKDGIEYLKFCKRIADYQLSPYFPNGFSVNP